MMTIDTNIVVRYLIKDDEKQAKLAIELIKNNRCMLLKTVLLETVWVLSSKQGCALNRAEIVERLRHLLKLPTLVMEDINNVILALYWYELGMGFADALHLSSSLQSENFISFDKKMVNKAKFIKINHLVRLLK
jgi:predicted nucleic-acid-binding protein